MKQHERQYWDGFRDALVVGRPDPSLPEFGVGIAEQPYYRRGFKDGERAVKRIRQPSEGETERENGLK